MSGRIYPCTSADPMGAGPQSGLLGQGSLPWPSELAARAIPDMVNISGYYATDDFSAAKFLVHELKAPESTMSAQENEEAAQQLVELLRRLKKAASVSAKELLALQKEAESIPVVGALLFSPSNFPGTLASVGGAISALSKTKRLVDLIDVPADVKDKLKKWANTRASSNSTSAKRALGKHIKLVRIAGNLHFEVPATASAGKYRIYGKMGASTIHLPAFQTAGNLNQRVYLHGKGARGVAKVMGGSPVGALLAFGPQAYMDGRDSKDAGEFMRKSAYSQPTNAAAFLTSAAFTSGALFFGAPLVIGIIVGMGAGAIIQYVIVLSGADRRMGDSLTR